MKSRIGLFFCFSFFIASSMKAEDKVLYSKDTIFDSVRLYLVVYKEKKADDITRILLKIIPMNESISFKFLKEKTGLMFKKLEAIQVTKEDNSNISANDYIYEELLDSYILIYNYLGLDYSKITEIKLIDNLITNSKSIRLL